mmetsp:Transcript_8552/g.12395  ORF Transcript_8552/g.12395 Transcript_8552/m.12395 type:complete len:920 (+) Transcript_8552:43-2802(+)
MFSDWIGRRSNDDSLDELQTLHKELLVSIGLGKDIPGTQHEIDTLPHDASSSVSLVLKGNPDDVNTECPKKSKRNLPTALKLLSATAAADNGGAAGTRDDLIGASLELAKKMEERTANLVCEIGKLVAYNDQAGSTFRSDEVFEYFCEKNIISLFVDIVRSKPLQSELHGNTWGPLVKAEALRTVSVLISSAQDGPSLYYLLSNNCVTSLIMGIVPLTQWSDPALELMLPAYTELLQSLVHHLVLSPSEIFTFLKVGEKLPLFSSTVEVAISPRSDSFTKSKCLNLIVTMLRIRDSSFRSWISHLMFDIKLLLEYACDRIISCYSQMVNLLVGPVVDHMRSNAIGKQLKYVKKQIEYLNQLLQSGIRSFNVLFCEIFLRNVVATLLDNLLSNQSRSLLAVGVSDVDVIPEAEALVQSSLVFFTHFWSISYRPLLRMIAVALFHQNSTTLWRKTNDEIGKERYAMTRELSKIAEMSEIGSIPNEYRQKILSFLTGQTGEWVFIPASMLIEGALSCKALDAQIMASLGLLPKLDCLDGNSYPNSPLEEALTTFLIRKRQTTAEVVTMALKRVCILALRLFSIIKSTDRIKLARLVQRSPLVEALASAHYHFCQSALSARQQTGVSDIFIDLTQLAIQSRYPKLSMQDPIAGKKYGCVLDNFGYHSLMLNPEILVRRLQTLGSNNVEDCRIAIEMALQFRATCEIVMAAVDLFYSFPKIEWANDTLLTIGDLKEKPTQGADLDLRGRMIFQCHAAANALEQLENSTSGAGSVIRTQSVTKLIMVLDPTDVFIVKPFSRLEANRGTIICTVSLRSIIAFASDNEWLHIAIRNMEDIGSLVKNGNMALHFESVGTCLIVKQYIERSQHKLRNELRDLIGALFQRSYIAETKANISSNEIKNSHDINDEMETIPQAENNMMQSLC